MYFTSGQDRAFERLMQEKPGFDHYDCGGVNITVRQSRQSGVARATCPD